MRVVFVFDHFGPYHLARISAAAKVPEWDVWGIELHPKSRTYAWDSSKAAFGFHKISLPNVGLRCSAERFALLPHLERALASCLPDVVFVNGWGDFMSLETIRWAKKQGVRLVVMSETRLVDGARSWWGEWVKSRIVGLCDAGLCGGESHRRYLGELGLARERVVLGYNAVDNDFFAGAKKSGQQDDGRQDYGEGVERGEAAVRPIADGGGLMAEGSKLVPSSATGVALDAGRWSLDSGLPARQPYFLASNRFIERKNLERLIRAYARYCAGRAAQQRTTGRQDYGTTGKESGPQWSNQKTPRGGEAGVWPLVLLGDGELRGELEGLCGELGLRIADSGGLIAEGSKLVPSSATGDSLDAGRSSLDSAAQGAVIFAGFRQVEELRDFYAGAGAFIHPALAEPWGLVINEAMASGLPILSSNNVGAAEELVQEGVNGFWFDPDDVEELAGLMGRVAGMSPEERVAMGEASRRLIAEWGPERFARGAEEAVSAAMSAPTKCAGILDRILLEVLIRK